MLVGTTIVGCNSSTDGPAPTPDAGFAEPDAGFAPPDAGFIDAGPVAPVMVSNIANLGPLGPADANGVRLPPGFTSRIVARSGVSVTGGPHIWHVAPDGGAVYPTDDDGWIYVSNSEIDLGRGGAGALRFASDGTLVDSYSILNGTTQNCAGGPTPWGTWLSCEEFSGGQVWECDPLGQAEAILRPALGTFSHEAVAVDPVLGHLYLTEDEEDGRLYRFTPAAYPNIAAGTLDVLQVQNFFQGTTAWLPLPDPTARSEWTRYQVPDSTAFNGGEGIWYHDGVVYFSTKGDNRVWAYDTATERISILYDQIDYADPSLFGVDNIIVSPDGDVVVAEDGDDLQIVAITPDKSLVPLMQLEGHDYSEITGPAFDPSLSRLYFSSQRGTTGYSADGITFEISGPFFIEQPG